MSSIQGFTFDAWAQVAEGRSLLQSWEEVLTSRQSETEPKKYLAYENGRFRAVTLASPYARFLYNMGWHQASPKRVAKALLRNGCEQALRASTLTAIGRQYQASAENRQAYEKAFAAQELLQKIFNQAHKSDKTPDLFGDHFADWMSELPEDLRQRNLRHVVLPGTHDSGAFQIRFSRSPFSRFVLTLLKIVPFAKSIIRRWAKTQRYTIREQLEHGARYLDLRVSFNPRDGKFYLSHSFASIPLEDALRDIRTFMTEHRSEVVVVSMKHDHTHRQGMRGRRAEAVALIERELGEHLLPATEDSIVDDSVTIDRMVAANKRVLLFHPKKPDEDYPNIWSQSRVNNFWANTSDRETKRNRLFRRLANVRERRRNDWGEVPWTLTPSARDIVRSVFRSIATFGRVNTSIRTYAETMQPHLDAFLQDCPAESTNQVSSLIFDYISPRNVYSVLYRS